MSANHNRNINNLLKVVNNASSIGVDAIKLQLYKAEKMTIDIDLPEFKINKKNPWSNHKTFYELFKKGETPYEWFPKIMNVCKKKKIDTFLLCI